MDQIIGKVESINKGENYCNVSIILESKKNFNIKLNMDDDKLLVVGKIYVFGVEAFYREDVKQFKAVSITSLEKSNIDKLTKEKLYSIFYDYAPMSLENIKKGVESYLGAIRNTSLKKVTQLIYEKFEDKFYLHPAATKFHHAYIGWLAYHTYTMLKLVDALCLVYDYLNKDLLYAATILHDISKIDEITGVDGEYTTDGLLLGHLVLGSMEIDQAAHKLGLNQTEEVLLLKHLMISHHGQLNFGSPKKPQTAEALLLWYVDSIDSKFSELKTALDSIKPGEFTSNVGVLDKMRFYKPKL